MPTATSATSKVDLWEAGEERQCHRVLPKGWRSNRTLYGNSNKPQPVGSPIQQYEIDMQPPAGDPLALKGLLLSFRIRPYYVHELRPAVMAAYPNARAFNAMLKKPPASLSATEHDFRSSLDRPDEATSDEWAQTRAVTASPALIDGVGVVRLQLIQNNNWKPIDAFTFRSREQNKNATVVTTQKINRWSDGVAQRAQAILNPRHRTPDGGGPLANRLVYEYACWASNEMTSDEFSSACQSFIERSTLSERFPTTSCVATADGIDFAPD